MIQESGFVQVLGFPDYYVNRDGRIYSNKTGKYLKNCISKTGYCNVKFRLFGKAYCFNVHRIIAMTFIPNPHDLKEVNHKDGNKKNNTVENLEWVSSSGNKRHAYRNGLMRSRAGVPNKKLAKPILQIGHNGELLRRFESHAEAQKFTGASRRNIHQVLSGKRKTAGGYGWKHEEVSLVCNQ